jgi:hypothetical protein
MTSPNWVMRRSQFSSSLTTPENKGWAAALPVASCGGIMKHLLCAVAALAVSTPASAEVVFRGTIEWNSAQACRYEKAGFDYTSVYHPNQPSTNKNFSGLTHVHQFGGAGYGVSGAFTGSFRDVTAGGLGWDSFAFEGAQVRVTQRVPNVITADTRFVTLKGQIKKPFGDPGVGGGPCIVTFEAAYQRSDND